MEKMDVDFDVEDLLYELKGTRENSTIPLPLLARHLDMPKGKVLKLIYKARKQIFEYGLLIVQAETGGYYLKRFDSDA